MLPSRSKMVIKLIVNNKIDYIYSRNNNGGGGVNGERENSEINTLSIYGDKGTHLKGIR